MGVRKVMLIGVTASGKGALGFELARKLDGEIISVDSMKVYKGMDVGTAKPSRQRRQQVRYHLVDVVEPGESFDVGRFYAMATEAKADIVRRDKAVIAVGGTGLYVKALLCGLFEGPGRDAEVREKLRRRAKEEGLASLHRDLAAVDVEAAERIHPNDEKRILRALEVYELTGKGISQFQQQWEGGDSVEQSEWTVIGLRRAKDLEGRRINARVKRMVKQGLVEEVMRLVDADKTERVARGEKVEEPFLGAGQEVPLSDQARCAIGYAEIIEYLGGEVSLAEAVENIKVNTRRLAKGQRTWFKRLRGVNWIDVGADETNEEVLEKAERILNI